MSSDTNNNPAQNTPPPTKVLSSSNADNIPPIIGPISGSGDPETSFLEMVLEAHEATPSKGISVELIKAFVRTRYALPETAIAEMLSFTMQFAVDSQLLVKVGGRKADPMSWTTRLNPAFILILLRRVREEAKAAMAVAENRKRKAADEVEEGSLGGSGRKVARI